MFFFFFGGGWVGWGGRLDVNEEVFGKIQKEKIRGRGREGGSGGG